MSPAPPKQAVPAHDPAVVQQHIDDGAKGRMGREIPDVPLVAYTNVTPFPSQYFQSVDCHARVFHTVVLRVTYDMAHKLPDGSLAYAKVQTALATKDEWSGTVNDSSPLWESDYAPYKPQCDVLVVNAVSRPPHGRAAQRWPCAVALKWQQDGKTQHWNKQLTVTGPRRFGLMGRSKPEVTSNGVVIDWQNAYGGCIKKPLTDELNPDGSVKKAAGSDRWDTDERNPVGVGLNKSSGQPGPQLEVFGKPYTDAVGQHRYLPMGFSAVGKAWLPRRHLAGTYDNAWLKNQWPLPPMDFDDRYWNCAPSDQQLSFLPPGTEVLLANLYPPTTVQHDALSQEMQRENWQGRLPGHQLWVGLVAKSKGDLMWVDRKMNLDTLVVDMAEEKIYAIYRLTVVDGADKNIHWQEMHTVLTSGPPDRPIADSEWGLLR